MGTSSSIRMREAYTHASSSLEAIAAAREGWMALQLGDNQSPLTQAGRSRLVLGRVSAGRESGEPRFTHAHSPSSLIIVR
ncbi:hypothetical protein E2C01_030671 [Portunus trituberculatus]|uniref:Uncharacterized protein n=1 Tax=Portunus trituberculatus TaxID=210409 RepID=A0A5B7EVG3_PORTR|nr:hypothetical protein [Portunus trituberculatus]